MAGEDTGKIGIGIYPDSFQRATVVAASIGATSSSRASAPERGLLTASSRTRRLPIQGCSIRWASNRRLCR